MIANSLKLPPGFDGQVRLFPLGDVVMFPGAVLPLHIFESRYREMLEDAVQNDQLITMCTLLPGFGHEYYGRPPIAPTVCIGRVADYEKTEQGTYNLTLVGLHRAQIEHEIEPVRAYRRATVQLIQSNSLRKDEERGTVGNRLAELVSQKLPGTEKLVEAFVQGNISLGSLADVAAFYLPLSTELKLQLLAEPDVLTRTKLLVCELAPAESENSSTPKYPRDFSDN